MAKVKLTVTHSECRGAYHKQGDCFVVEELCPPICHELWNVIYPYVFVLQNGGNLDCGDTKAQTFCVRCPDGGRVAVRGELLREDEGSR